MTTEEMKAYFVAQWTEMKEEVAYWDNDGDTKYYSFYRGRQKQVEHMAAAMFGKDFVTENFKK